MSSLPENTLQPLVSPQSIQPSSVAPAVNWFQKVAPRLSEEAEYRRRLYTSAPDPSGVSGARFQQIEQMLWEEKQERLKAQQEPSEITQLRLQALNEAEKLLQEAQEKAEQIRAEAFQQAYAKGEAEGHQAGYSAGFSQGTAEAHANVQAQFAQEQALYRADIQNFLDYIERERIQIWEQFEPQVVRMVSDMVRHIIKKETEESDQLVLSTVRNTLRRVVEGTSLRIRVNPADLETTRNYRAEILEMLDGIRHLEILEDRRVGRGGCVMETESGNIDARIETQLQLLGDVLDQVQQDTPEEN